MTHRLPVEALLLVTVVLWGLNFSAIKYCLTHGFGPLALPPLRWGIAGCLLAAITWQLEGGLSTRRRDLAVLVGVAVLGLWLNQVAFSYAAVKLPISSVALIFGIFPVLVALFSHIGRIERLHARNWLGAGVSFLGAAFVALGTGGTSGNLAGIFLALTSIASWAAYSVVVVPLLSRYSPYLINGLIALVGSAMLAATGAVQLAHQTWNLPTLVWLSLLYSSIVAIAFANTLWFRAVERVGPSRASLYANMQPFLGAVFAVVLLSEQLGLLQIVGGAVIAAGIVLGRSPRSHAVPAE